MAESRSPPHAEFRLVAAILDRIIETKRSEVVQLRKQRPTVRFSPRAVKLKRSPGDPLRILAEIKFRSPSAGALSTELSVSERAKAYERGGASVVSVLCDSTFFGGAYEHLIEARDNCSLPLLCKEFVIDEVQLDWAHACGADLVLLIARCVGPEELVRLHAAALERNLTPLVEIANHEEAGWARALPEPIIGVNARDLDNLQMDSQRASDVLSQLGPSLTRLHLSGIKTPEDVTRTQNSGVDGALIGEILMRDANPEARLRSLVQAAHP